MADLGHAFCLKCQAKVPVRDPVLKTLSNTRYTMAGTCPTCTTPVSRIIGRRPDARGYRHHG